MRIITPGKTGTGIVGCLIKPFSIQSSIPSIKYNNGSSEICNKKFVINIF